ncbi:hypothetical protein H4R33_006883 [Dimargaris cristalligena]|uniref:Uncharacterized protein n=1 Tax=Dimargaris cristalligena TaxID=215637 RepID=A0A4Q0A2T7_9FUNG|nr:hypothetical protein H4R33_006883 [Dimargaris cristalligena]RKP39682.1 hypothetical protein BJ085DRAFT_28662 [Dimargaris cristalligena]|eukprot:RKP39682.1 hypothetical protein BJ085DRAFT_28662 [Dimargaris cristalligena]
MSSNTPTPQQISDPPFVPQLGLPSGALDTLLKNVKPFTGKPPGPTWDSWKLSLTATTRDYYPQMAPGAQFRLTIALLQDDIRDLVIKASKDTTEHFEAFMKATYPASLWAEYYDTALHSGTLFKGKNIHVACTIANDAAWQLGGTSHWCIQVTKALLAEFHPNLEQAPNELWNFEEYTAGTMAERFKNITQAVLAYQGRQAALRTAPGRGPLSQGVRELPLQGTRDPSPPSTESIVAAVLAAMKGGTPTTNSEGKGRNRRRRDRQAKEMAELRAENTRLQLAMNNKPGKA